VIVVGAGAAGLVAAERAAARGKKTLLLERNRKAGVKILMSGGTRCNLTQATDRRRIVEAFGVAGQFLHSALAALEPQELVALVEEEGVPTKVEETGKIFPVSNRATDVLAAFLARLGRSGCELVLDESLVDLERGDDGFRLVTSRRELRAQSVIVTTGGQSYPGCGTTGDGYRWARELGHTIVRPRPALVPVTTSAEWVRSLSGITIGDVRLRLMEPGERERSRESGGDLESRVLDTRRGSMLFTHFGLSGPVVLDISREVSGHPRPNTLWLECDFLPGESAGQLDEHLRQQAASEGKKQLLSLVPEMLPRRLAAALVTQAALTGDSKAGELSKAGREALVEVLKRLAIPVAGTRGFAKAEVTAGGISLDEVDSRSMQSKLARRLYLAGEVLDLDGPIGGYNFQAAFSTGWLAGLKV
jgi:predicted Rossmann fold flavoprotein